MNVIVSAAKKAPIVLMDEPSSALDTYSENAVLEDFESRATLNRKPRKPHA
ncbi:Hypothetical protein EUBELI_01509 [Lachnospira eligens ATCC 27750]|jgi:ABC-type bacteriocin/lantibiotic exporter with double-glycine peptidase domain|uniref:Uncharacterized protein n=1 Tax=Lachnospira eligens (strain ATCC 27750 / DSM 3376 / VPI C15-48 / C15-B4) TaxID=515620 RepID=C4Z2C6_LACE2|nr:Hypothetical protein EUBELI_01509 [[Eubacterium] eligens ATCC 27750]